MTTLAVFGGSFNPPHIAHQMVALYVLETQPVDAILVVPTFRHPFDKQLAPYEHRMEMARLAMAPFGARAIVSDLERSLGGEASLTVRTLEALVAAYPGAALRLVIGSDILRERDKWYRWDDIERIAPPIVVARAGFPVADNPVEVPAISSTDVRARIARGEPAVPLVPRAVSAYIQAHGLYL
jgi:nicotinate-nucleotide adenylyltransferase